MLTVLPVTRLGSEADVTSLAEVADRLEPAEDLLDALSCITLLVQNEACPKRPICHLSAGAPGKTSTGKTTESSGNDAVSCMRAPG